MVISKDLLDILVCPENRSPLKLADASLIERLNAQIVAGQLTNRLGSPVQTHLAGGLVREDRKFLYPIVDDIPILLIDEAIPLEQAAD